MDHRHLWIYVQQKQHAIMEIRNAIIYASYEFFDKNGFIKFVAQFFQEMRLKIQHNYSKQIASESSSA